MEASPGPAQQPTSPVEYLRPFDPDEYQHLGDFSRAQEDMYAPEDETGDMGEAFWDPETYRFFQVVHRRGKPAWRSQTADEQADLNTEASATAREEESQATARLLRPLLHNVEPDVVAVDISKSGTKVLWTSANPKYDFSMARYFPSILEYQLGGEPPLRSLLRSQLVVADRLQPGVDKVEYPDGDGQLAVFKYNPHSSGIEAWHEIQVLAQVSGGHAHILPIDALVFEEVTGQGVVGFTSRFVPGGTLDDRRQFKRKWLHEAMAVIDHLNLQRGLSHQDIASRNLLIDPDTDALLLFDFGHSWPVASGRETLTSRNDPKGLLVAVYHLVTRDPRFDVYYLHDVDETPLEDRAQWKKHPDVELDCDLDNLFDELIAWVRQRRDGPQPTAAVPSNPVIIPTCPKGPKDVAGDDAINLASTLAWVRTLHGRPNLRWHRPRRHHIDKSRRLLATGRYADEEPHAPQFVAADPKLGFPQPPKQSPERSADKCQPLVINEEPTAPQLAAAHSKLEFPQPPKQESLHQEPSAANKSQPVVDGEKKKRKRTRKQPPVSDKPAKRQAGAGAGAGAGAE